MGRTKLNQLKSRVKDALRVIKSLKIRPENSEGVDFVELFDQLQSSISELEKDNSRLKTLKKELEKKQKDCALLFDLSPIGYLILDRNGMVGKVNKAFSSMVDLPQDNIVGKGFAELILPEDRERFALYFSAALSGSKDTSIDLRFQKNNKAFWGMLKISALDQNEEGSGQVLINVSDVTDQKNLEEDRNRINERINYYQRLESLGILAGGIAHDFNNLLTIIRGNSELSLLSNLPSRDLKKYLLEIVSATERASKLTGQMLAYAGQGIATIQTVDLAKEIESLEQLIKTSVYNQINVEFDLQKNCLAEVDLNQLQQVVMNTLINSSEAIGPNFGKIKISCYQTALDPGEVEKFVCWPDKIASKYVCIEITDTGDGMEKEVADKVFDPFFSTKFTGRGLGMASVLGIVKRHSGAITQYSIPDQGSVFKFFFPAFTGGKAGADDSKPEIQGSLIFRGRALITEDEPIIGRLMENFLKNMGFEVTCVENGLEGCKFIEQNPENLSLAIIDMIMPEMDGREFFTLLRKKYECLPVIFCSGYSAEFIPENIREDANVGFVQKPFSWKSVEKEIVRLYR